MTEDLDTLREANRAANAIISQQADEMATLQRRLDRCWSPEAQAYYEALEAEVGRARVRLDPEYRYIESGLEESVVRVMDVLDRVRAALDTAETGEGLIGVAANAHRAELEAARSEVNDRVLSTLEVADTLAKALEGVVNSACHPDVAQRAALVNLGPVREALKVYTEACGRKANP